MKKYMVYMDDGRDCFKAAIPAANEKAARKYVEGNGEVIAIKDVTKEVHVICGDCNVEFELDEE